jgi:hypothetical protein
LYELANDDSKEVYEKVDELKYFVEEMVESQSGEMGACLASDMLTAALEEVNYLDIIRSHDEQ